MKVVRSAQRTGRLYPREIFLVLISFRGCQSQWHSAAGRIVSMKNSNDTIGHRTRIFRLVARCLNELRHRVPPCNIVCLFVSFWRGSPQWARASFTRFLDHTQRRTTVSRTPLDEWSARCRDLYLTTHNSHNRQTSMPLVRFEPTISAGERPQTYALDRAVTGTGI